MAAQKKAKAPEPAGESAPMWIVSFADLVTLLMSFFVVLYAMKQGGAEQQMEQMAAFKVQFDPNYVPPDDSPVEWQNLIHRFKGDPGPPYQDSGGLAKQPTDGAQGRDQAVQTIRAGKIVAGGRVLFASNSAAIDDAGKEIIKQVVETLRGRTNILYIKGHASDDEIIARPDDPMGVTLSYQRAVAVCNALQAAGIDPRVLRPVPCGTNERAQAGAYEAKQQQLNRRVEVYATDNTVSEFVQTPTVSVSPAAATSGTSLPGSRVAGAEEKEH
jgi:chemotaxis protein MotB